VRDPERYKGLFIFVFTTVVMLAVGLFLTWAKDTERWYLFAGYFVVLSFIIGKFWDYRPPD